MESKIIAPAPQEMSANNPQVMPPQLEALPQPANFDATPEKLVQPDISQNIASATPMLPVPVAQKNASSSPKVPVLQPLAANDDNPTTASDEEVIEKEWVDKAKKIITQTKDDPYKQEKEVSKLQADYLKKRYGKEIKIAED